MLAIKKGRIIIMTPHSVHFLNSFHVTCEHNISKKNIYSVHESS